MTYKLRFRLNAEKEWRKLDAETRRQLAKKLDERLENPKVPASRLHGMKDCYKIKRRTRGYRLVYQVQDQEQDEIVTVVVIAVGNATEGTCTTQQKSGGRTSQCNCKSPGKSTSRKIFASSTSMRSTASDINSARAPASPSSALSASRCMAPNPAGCPLCPR
jgi:mRNA interferase RelE/StbE